MLPSIPGRPTKAERSDDGQYMTGGETAVGQARWTRVQCVFGYPGGTILNVYDELFKCSDRIRHILTAHEQGAAHAADGYARSTGRVGVVMATMRPRRDESRHRDRHRLHGLGSARRDHLQRPQQDPRQGQLPGSGHSGHYDADHQAQLHREGRRGPRRRLEQAFEIATTGRRGPVLVDVTKDVTAAKTEWVPTAAGSGSAVPTAVSQRFRAKRTPVASDAELDEAAALIAKSSSPFIYAGGGVIASGASEELRALVERLKAPVALSLMGHGAFPSRHPLFTGMIGMHGTKASNMASSRSDLLIAVGARFSDRVVSDASRFATKAKLLHIDIDPAEINKNVPSYKALVGDVKDILGRLLERLPERAKFGLERRHRLVEGEVPSAHGRDTLLSIRSSSWQEIHSRVRRRRHRHHRGRPAPDVDRAASIGFHEPNLLPS